MAEEPTLVKKSRKRSKYPVHWIVIPLVVLAAGGLVIWRVFRTPGGPFVLPGYITSLTVFDDECTRFYGKAANSADAREKFQLAADAMAKRDNGGAAGLLEAAAKEIAIPVIFNDLGVLYAKMDDRSRTLNAFREALARDSGYGPARQNLERLKGLDLTSSVYPVTREIEPNNTLTQANLISFDKPVDGEIVASLNDVDCYRINAPARPRDLLQVEITNGSQTLAPNLSLYDDNMAALSSQAREAGASITQTLSPPPNATTYFKIWGSAGSGGKYNLTVRMLKAFDAYEPNDEIFNAAKIVTGQPIEANIMDAQDSDFYSFESPRTGTVTIEIQNRSTTLIPVLTTFANDKSTTGFGPDVKKAGGSLRHTIETVENKVYYVQVWSAQDTAGAYTLTIR